MLDKTNRFINVCVKNMHDHTIFTAEFRCNNCKHFVNCPDMAACDFATYLTARLPQTTHTYGKNCMSVNVRTRTMDDYNRAIQTINRAKRLRTLKPLLRTCR